MKNTSKLRLQDGTALLELALSIPLLLLLTFGVIDLGRWFNLHFIVSRITYEGARYASSARHLTEGKAVLAPGKAQLPSGAHSKVLGRMQDLLQLNGIDRSSARLSVEHADPSGENYVVVRTEVPFTPLLVKLFPAMGYSSSLQAFTICVARTRAPYLYSTSTEE